MGREICDLENKNGQDMHSCVQLGACNWWDVGGGGAVRGAMRL